MGNIQTRGPKWLYLVTSRDAGTSWTRTTVVGPYATVAHIPSLTRARNGTLYMGMVIGNDPTDTAVSVLVSRNDGASWKDISLADNVAFDAVGAVWVDARPDGSATAAWLAVTPQGRQVWAARVGPKGVVVPAQAISTAVHASSGTYEFIMVDHDATGRAHIVAPLETSPNCHRPSDIGRGTQCIYDFIER
jgi:hypothetical protein